MNQADIDFINELYARPEPRKLTIAERDRAYKIGLSLLSNAGFLLDLVGDQLTARIR